MSTQYNQLIELGEDAKLIAATEVGSAPLPDQLIAYEAHWLWFCVWGDTFINNEEYNSAEVLNEVSTCRNGMYPWALLTGTTRSTTTIMFSRWTRSRVGGLDTRWRFDKI